MIGSLRGVAPSHPCTVLAPLQVLYGSASAVQGVLYVESVPSYASVSAVLDQADLEGIFEKPLLNPYSVNRYAIEIQWRAQIMHGP